LNGALIMSKKLQGQDVSRALNELMRHAVETRDIASFLNLAVKITAELLDAHAGLIHLHDPSARKLRLASVWQQDGFQLDNMKVVPDDERLLGRAFQDGRPVALPDLDQEPDLKPETGPAAMKSVIIAPLLLAREEEQEVLGTLLFSWKRKNAFDREAVQLVETVGCHVALVLENLKVSVEREKTAQELSEMAERSLDLMEKSSDGIAWVKNGKIIYLNPAMVSMLRIKEKSEAEGKDVHAFVDGENKDLLKRTWQEFEKSGRLPERIELRSVRSEGTLFIAEVAFSLLMSPDGEPLVQATVRDITARTSYERMLAASEKKWRKLFELANQAIISIDERGRIHFANKRAGQILGRKEGELIGMNINEVTAPRWKNVIKELFLSRREAPVEQEEIELEDAGGSAVEVMINAGPVYGENKELQGYTIFLTDMSETKSLREQLYASEKMTAVGRLAGGIAHEFNNIHAAIQGYVELMMRQPHMTDEDLEDLESVRELIKRASHITRQLLAFARKDIPQREKASLPGIVRSNVRMIRKEYQSEGIKIIEAHDSKLAPIELNPGKIGQLVMELLINAHDAVIEGEGRKVIKVETGMKDGSVFIRVSDTGVGMREDAKKRVFEPFYTTKGALGGSSIMGTGLGLSVVHSIVRDHGGSIEVQSEPGQGSAFTVNLPVREKTKEPAPTRSASFGRVMVGARVLIVDDEMDIVSMLGRAMSLAGYEAEVTMRAKEAARRLHADSYDLVLLDLRMPDMRGEDLLEVIEGLPEHTRPEVVVLTGKAGVAGPQDFQSAQVAAVIKKPFSLEELFAAVYRTLEQRQKAAV